MTSSSSSIIGVSSIYQTPSSELPRRATAMPALFLPFAAEKSHFNGLKASAASFCPKQLVGCGVTGGPSSIATAVASPNFSLLREEAFKGLEGFGDSDSEYESEADELESSSGAASSVDELSVSNLGHPKRLIDSLANRGITELFPIQRTVFVLALEGRDIIARAKTGTGKTLAFGIPVLKRLNEDERSSLRRGRLPRMLVLAPTRELASQVDKELKESTPYLSTICVYGGVSYNLQQNALSCGVDIGVGTPCRLIDLIKSNSLKLGEVEYIVLDEADQMLAVGFEEDVETILENLPAKRQSMLFSATMPVWVKKLARKYLNNPLTIDLVRCKIPQLCTEDGIQVVVTDYGEGDHTDFILSTRAYSRLACPNAAIELFAYGVVDIEFQRVPCKYSGYNLMV